MILRGSLPIVNEYRQRILDSDLASSSKTENRKTVESCDLVSHPVSTQLFIAYLPQLLFSLN